MMLRADSDSGNVWSYIMTESGMMNGAFRYSVRVRIAEMPIFTYYFAFIYGGRSYYYAKRGIMRNVPIRTDRFTLIPSLEAPAWVSSSTCYQIFPDRFCNGDPDCGAKEGEYEFDGGRVTVHDFSEKPQPFPISRCLDFYNGDLKGIEKKIDYLKALGINVLYINPINTALTVHRYDSIDFFHVDPKLGGDEALISLIEKLHEHGIRIIVDISINHTGTASPWFKKAIEDENADERDFYIFEDGNPSYWQGVKTLSELNYTSDRLRDLIYRNKDSAMQRFLRPPFNQDGWRLDVAAETGRRPAQQTKEIWREVRQSLKSVKKDLYLVGEDWDDSSEYLQGDMWDGCMNYYGSGRILRSWIGERDRFLSAGWGHDPESEAPWSGIETALAIADGVRTVPDQMAFFQMNLIDSHDTPRLHLNARVMDRDIYYGGLMALFLLPGMPSIYYGDEILLDGEMGSVEGARYPMSWNEDMWDKETLSMYRTLSSIRKLSFLPFSAFMTEGFDNDAFIIKRIGNGEAIVAVINKCERTRTISVDSFALPKGSASVIAGRGVCMLTSYTLDITLDGKKSVIVHLKNAPLANS